MLADPVLRLLESPWFLLLVGGTFVGSLIVLPILVAAIPRDYFAEPEAPVHPWAHERRWLYLVLRIAANLLGFLLFAAGVAMLVLPGQGLLTMLLGLGLMSFPGKRRLELALVRRRGVATALNWIRRRAGRPALVVGVAPSRDP